MPNVLQNFNAVQQTGYVGNRLTLPQVNTDLSRPVPTYSATAAITDNQTPENWGLKAVKALVAAPVDIIDTASSIFGPTRGSVDTAFWNTIGMPEMGRWVDQNRGAVDATSGLIGSVAIGAGTDIAVGKLLGSTWFAATGLGKAVAPIIQSISKAKFAAAEASLQAARAGTTLSPFSGEALKYFALSQAGTVARAGTAELAIDATLHNNEAVWSDDMSTNMFFGALGLAIPSAITGIAVRGQFLKWANSPEVRFARAETADPAKMERMLNQAPIGTMTGAPPVYTRDSAVITDMALNARRDDSIPTGVGPQRLPTDERVKTQNQTWEKLLTRLSPWTSKGIEGVNGTEFTVNPKNAKAGSAGNHVAQALGHDPALFYGATEVGQIPEELSGKAVVKAYDDRTARMLQSKTPKVVATAVQRKSTQPQILIGDTWMNPDDAELFTQYTSKTSDDFELQATGQMQTTAKYSTNRYTINEDGGLPRADYNNLPIPDLIQIREGMNRLQASLLKKHATVTVPKNATHYQLDYAIEYSKRGGDVDFSILGQGATAEDAQMRSLILKGKAAKDMAKFGMRERYVLNLPMPTAAEHLSDPNHDVFKNWLMSANPNTTLGTMKMNRVESQRIFDLTQDVKGNESLDGNFFGFNRDNGRANGEWLRPVVGYFQDTPAQTWTRFNLSDQIQEGKVVRISDMMSNPKAPVTKTITGAILQDPAVRDGMDISGLHDSQLPGTENVVSASASQMLSQAMRFRNIPTMKAAQQIQKVAHQFMNNVVTDIFTRLKPTLDSINSAASAKSKVLFNQYWSHAAGWDISGTKDLGNGNIGFILDPGSGLNRARLHRPLQADELMINTTTGAPVVLDQLGDQMRTQFESALKALAREQNVNRVAKGLSEVNIQKFYTNPRDLTGKFHGYTIDSAGRAVSNGAVVENTLADYNAAAERVRASIRHDPSLHFHSSDELKAMGNAWYIANLDNMDPYALRAPTGIGRAGATPFEINSRSIEDAIGHIKRGYEQVTKDILSNIFDTQLMTAEIRHAANITNKSIKTGTKDIWQTYIETLLGTTYDSNTRGLTGLFQAGDEVINHAIAYAWPAVAIPATGLRSFLGQLGYSNGRIMGKSFNLSNIKSFDQLATELGPYMPFQTAMDYVQHIYKIPVPPQIKGISRSLNKLGASVILRWLELPQAAMNMTGIITNTPGLLNSKTAPTVGKLNGVNIIDSMKIMAKAFARMTHERSGADWQHMVDWGDSKQEFAAFHQGMSVIKSQSTFNKVMFGDKSIKVKPGDVKGFAAYHGIDGLAGYFTDTTESLARTWAHFTGLELADHLGITGMEARHNFARNIANDTIANYDPLNKPEIYNSGIGSLYGLFLSYSQNYYQRMFRWIEDGRYGDVGRSLGMQAAMFGAAGVPGWNQMSSLYSLVTNNRGTDGQDFIDSFYEKFGPSLGSVLAHGGFDQLINIASLGAIPAVALHTRGDQNFRTPASDFLTSGGTVPIPPGVEVVKDLLQGTLGVLSSIASRDPTVTPQYLAETMARVMPNRLIHGAITVLLAGGNDADVNGNVMAQTQSTAESVIRFLGLRTARQQGEIDSYYSNQRRMEYNSTAHNSLLERTRALVRAGSFDKLPQVFQEYVDTGGRPSDYPAWIRHIIQTAGSTRAQNQLLQSMRSPNHQQLARRIELFTGGQ